MSEHDEVFPTPSQDTFGQLYVSDAGVYYLGDFIQELGFCWVQVSPPPR